MAGQLIFRNDDVTASSNIDDIREMYNFLMAMFPYPKAEIWSCVNLFSRGQAGSVYPELPLRGRPKEWFYTVDKMWEYPAYLPGKIVSHGLFHSEHAKLSRDAQEMSILSSCRYLNTNIFVAPFSSVNDDTKSICQQHDITLATDGEWKSLENETFDPRHPKWYWHSWRFNVESFKALFERVLV